MITGAAIVLWGASAASVATAVVSWRARRRSPGGIQFAAMVIGTAVWSVIGGVEAAALGTAAKVLFSELEYIGICSVPPLFVWFAFAHGRQGRPVSPLRLGALWVIPAVTIALVFTNSWHHLLWTTFSEQLPPARNIVVYGHGPWYWVWVAYSLVATILGTSFLVRATPLGERFYLRQALIFLLVAALPWMGEVFYLWPNSPLPGLDLVPVGFALSGVLLLVGVLKFRLFDVVPIARHDLVDHLSEGIIALDSGGRILDLNTAAREMTGADAGSIGLPAVRVLASIQDILEAANASEGEIRKTVGFPANPQRRFDLVLTRLGEGSVGAGRVLVLREITAAANEPFVGHLVPMCASCRKVRDTAGAWQSLEQHVQERWHVRFSHGVCDACMTKLYPELYAGGQG
jgi:PAS domain-containing protein